MNKFRNAKTSSEDASVEQGLNNVFIADLLWVLVSV